MPATAQSGDETDTGLRRFFSGAGLPVFLLTAVLLYELFLVAVVFAPQGWGIWSEFSVEFKVWCFGYDARTGGMAWAAFWVMIAEPLFIAATTAFLWRRALQRASNRTNLWRLRTPAAAGVLVAALVSGGLFAYGKPGEATDTPLPFPGERIRTALTPPPFQLVDQRGAGVNLPALHGRIVLVTGIYAMCSTSCPEILRELRTTLDALPGDVRERLVVLALSLNPEYDTADLMSRVAEGYGFSYPEFRYLNGDPALVGEVLQALGFSRSKNAETGIIDHANLVLLLDAQGKIAYRLNPTTHHRAWIGQALIALGREEPR